MMDENATQEEFLSRLEAMTYVTRAVLPDNCLDLNLEMDAVVQLIGAESITLWLLDREANELYRTIYVDASLEILRLRNGHGFAGKVVASGEQLNIPFDLYDHPDSKITKQIDQKISYRTYSLLCTPVVSSKGELLGVTELANKRKFGNLTDNSKANESRDLERFQTSFNQNDQAYIQVFNNFIMGEIVFWQQRRTKLDRDDKLLLDQFGIKTTIL